MSKSIFINNHLTSSLLDNKFKGPCIVIGSGISSGKLATFNEWKKYYSISCNFSQIHFPSHLYAYQDKEFIRRNIGFLSSHRILGLSILPTSDNCLKSPKLMNDLGGFFINRTRSNDAPWIKTKTSDPLASCSPITGVIAISMAYIMGFSPIIIFGFDTEPGSYYYYKPHPVWKKINPRGATIHAYTQMKFFKTTAQKLNIINCSSSRYLKQHDYTKVFSDLGQENYKESNKIIEEIYIENAKKFNNDFCKKYLSKTEVPHSS